jgi:hypothetical protein
MFLAYARHEQMKMDLVDALARSDDPNDQATQNFITNLIGCSLNEFSDRELAEMEREIAHKWTMYHS